MFIGARRTTTDSFFLVGSSLTHAFRRILLFAFLPYVFCSCGGAVSRWRLGLPYVRQKSKQQYPPKGMYQWGTDEKKRVRGCPSCPYNIKVGRCEVGLRKFPKITAVRRWYSSFGWNFRHNTTEWTFKNVVLAFQNVLTFENSLWWRLLVNDQKMGSQKLGAYEVRYKWKIQKSITSVN